MTLLWYILSLCCRITVLVWPQHVVLRLEQGKPLTSETQT